MRRRTFMQRSGLVTAGLLTLSPFAESVAATLEKKKRKLGVQLFTIPKMVDEDLKGTLKLLSEIGYREVEFFGPYPFSAPETIERWKGLSAQLGIKRNAFYGYSVAEVVAMMKEFRLKSPSMHLDLATMRKNMRQTLDSVAPMGVKYIAIPAIFEDDRKSLDDYKRLAEEFNGFGEQMAAYDVSFVYHNHGYEHWEREGKIPMELLLEQTHTDHVKFELDIFWMAAAGADPIDFLRRYPGRFKLMHVKDAAEAIRFTGDGGTPEQWMALFPKMADPGTGVFKIKEILAQASASGVEHFFLERDLTPTPDTTLRNSFTYLSQS
ncbi:MAG: sugar phosphate isomerase/epimerase [Bacteroidetes bacterium]|nr:MAG: sugar phosphate isomerase/epimerase [Bacteroidota bacterium]